MSSAPTCDVVPVDGIGQQQNTADGDPGAEAAVRLVVDAERIHADHVADEDGYCRGCLRHWDRLTRHPCSQDRWAVEVIGRYTDRRDEKPAGHRAR
jgi:hypothetical protein